MSMLVTAACKSGIVIGADSRKLSFGFKTKDDKAPSIKAVDDTVKKIVRFGEKGAVGFYGTYRLGSFSPIKYLNGIEDSDSDIVDAILKYVPTFKERARVGAATISSLCGAVHSCHAEDTILWLREELGKDSPQERFFKAGLTERMNVVFAGYDKDDNKPQLYNFRIPFNDGDMIEKSISEPLTFHSGYPIQTPRATQDVSLMGLEVAARYVATLITEAIKQNAGQKSEIAGCEINECPIGGKPNVAVITPGLGFRWWMIDGNRQN